MAYFGKIPLFSRLRYNQYHILYRDKQQMSYNINSIGRKILFIELFWSFQFCHDN